MILSSGSREFQLTEILKSPGRFIRINGANGEAGMYKDIIAYRCFRRRRQIHIPHDTAETDSPRPRERSVVCYVNYSAGNRQTHFRHLCVAGGKPP